jgi:hypothetical protein
MPYARRDLLVLAAHLGLGGALAAVARNAEAAAASPFLQHGYAPVLDELATGDLPVRGEVPREIAGTYLRNGPGLVKFVMGVQKTNKTGHFSLCLSAVKSARVRFRGLAGDLG